MLSSIRWRFQPTLVRPWLGLSDFRFKCAVKGFFPQGLLETLNLSAGWSQILSGEHELAARLLLLRSMRLFPLMKRYSSLAARRLLMICPQML